MDNQITLARGFETAQSRHDNLSLTESILTKGSSKDNPPLNQAKSNQDPLKLPAGQLANLALSQVF